MSKLQEYMLQNTKVGYFGNTYLDDRLKGILKGDLVLIGARSGSGKSTIAENIATYNASRDVKVTLISLENFEGDNYITSAYYEYKRLTQNWALDLRDFASGDFKIDMFALEKAEKFAENKFKNINLINRQEDYTREDLKNDIITQVKNEKTQLIIIDHLDYLDKYENETDISHISCLMKEIRQAQYAFKVPVVAISHLRKNNNSEIKIPNVDEFIGSSNKVKESTCVIMFAPDDEANMNNNSSLKATWCCVRKLRMGGVDNKAARLFFNQKTGNYEDEYNLFKVNYSGTKIEPLH